MQRLLLLVVLNIVLWIPTINTQGGNTCGPPPVIELAKPDVKGNEHSEGTVISYNCEFGFVTHGTTRTTRCSFKKRRDGTRQTTDPEWTPLNFSCIPRSCGHPGYVPNGFRVGSLFTFPNSVSFQCDDGYRLKGSSVRYCLASGSWSGKLPECEVTVCDAPKKPDKGRVSYSSLEYGSELRYECDQGYILDDPETRICLSNGTWSGNDPSCVEVKCDVPVPPDHGSADLIGGSPNVGSVVSYSCDGDRKLVGSLRARCRENGQWTFPTPECLEPCSVPEVPHGRIGRYGKYTGRFNKISVGGEIKDGEKLFLHCDAGYDPLGSSNWQEKIICDEGRWSAIPRCEKASCRGEPPASENAIPIISDIKHGTPLPYVCEEHFVKLKEGNMACHFGEWKGSLPVCSDTRCSVSDVTFSGLQNNGKRFYESGESFQPSCNEGYQLSRSEDSLLICEEGKWKGHLPPCKADGCPKDPPSIPHGKATIQSNTPGSTVKYTCDRFYSRIGGTTVQCELGQWTGRLPTCSDTRCYLKDLKNRNGVSTKRNNVTLTRNRLSVACAEGYLPNGLKPFCVNGEWTENWNSPCSEKKCLVYHINNGAITKATLVRNGINWKELGFHWKTVYKQVYLGATVDPGDELHVTCYKGFTFQGKGSKNVLVRCKEGKWYPRPVCLGPGKKYDDPEERRTTARPTTEDETSDSVAEPTPPTRKEETSVDEPPETASNPPQTESEPLQPENKPPQTDDQRDPSVCFCEFINYDTTLVAYVDHVRLRSRDRVRKGSSVKFQCKEFGIARLQGVSELKCETCESWHSSEFPTCADPVAGDVIIALDNDVRVNPDRTIELDKGQTVEFSCIAVGIEEYPVWQATMKDNVNTTTLLEVRRGRVQYISNLKIKDAEYKNDGQYQCAVPGYRLNVIDIRVIDPSVLCPKFEENEYFYVYYEKKGAVNSKASFHCVKEGQILHGPHEVTCLTNGSWSGGAPTCVNVADEIACPELKETETMKITYSDGLNAKSTASFHCIATAKRTGVSHVTCQESGEWSDPIPSCESSRCPVESLISALSEDLALYSDVTNASMPYGSTLRIKCKGKGLAAVGNTTAKCGTNGKWEFSQVQCVAGCLLSETASGSQLIIEPKKDIYKFGEFIAFSCPKGQTLASDTMRAVCFQGTWVDDEFPDCEEE